MNKADIIQTLQDEMIELQTKVQFQEDTIQQLDKIIIAQQAQLDRIGKRLIALEDIVKDLKQEQTPTQAVRQDKPPHY